MGRLQEEIENLVTMNIGKPKLGQRLIEAGIAAHTNIECGPCWLYVQDFETGEFDIVGEDKESPSLEELTGMTTALRYAGELFDEYARNHYTKIPPQPEKAERNVEAASKMFAAISEPYMPPPIPSETIAAFEAERPVQADSSLPALGGARMLIGRVNAAESDGEPLLGIRVHPDDATFLATLVEMGYIMRDDVSDKLNLTTRGREAIGLRPAGLPALPVEVAELTGNIEERELTARYIDGKIAGCERHIREGSEKPEELRYVAAVLTEIAHEFRIGLHLPAPSLEGRVIPYNDYRGDGVLYQEGLRTFFQAVHGSNVKAGWWTDIETGEPKLRNLGELLMLFVTEIVEAFDAYLDNANDDKLPDHPGLGVELADLGIRWADLCGALLEGRVATYSEVDNPGEMMFRQVCNIAMDYEKIRKTPEAVGQPEQGDPMPPMDVAAFTDLKLAYNATRADHKIENRLKADGKKT